MCFCLYTYLRIRAPRLELQRTLPLSVSNGADTSLAALCEPDRWLSTADPNHRGVPLDFTPVCKKSKGGREKDEEQVEEEVSRAHEEEVKVEEEEEEEGEGEPGVIVTREAAAPRASPAAVHTLLPRSTLSSAAAARLGVAWLFSPCRFAPLVHCELCCLRAQATAGPPAGRSLRAVGRETGAAVLAGRLGFRGR
ncbi:unnamed protein product [Arctogadus glacialis]